MFRQQDEQIYQKTIEKYDSIFNMVKIQIFLIFLFPSFDSTTF